MDFPLKRSLLCNGRKRVGMSRQWGYRQRAASLQTSCRKNINAPMQRFRNGERENKDNSVWATGLGEGTHYGTHHRGNCLNQWQLLSIQQSISHWSSSQSASQCLKLTSLSTHRRKTTSHFTSFNQFDFSKSLTYSAIFNNTFQ